MRYEIDGIIVALTHKDTLMTITQTFSKDEGTTLRLIEEGKIQQERQSMWRKKMVEREAFNFSPNKTLAEYIN